MAAADARPPASPCRRFLRRQQGVHDTERHTSLRFLLLHSPPAPPKVWGRHEWRKPPPAAIVEVRLEPARLGAFFRIPVKRAHSSPSPPRRREKSSIASSLSRS